MDTNRSDRGSVMISREIRLTLQIYHYSESYLNYTNARKLINTSIEELSEEIKQMWQLKPVRIPPLVALTTGTTSRSLTNELQKLKTDITCRKQHTSKWFGYMPDKRRKGKATLGSFKCKCDERIRYKMNTNYVYNFNI
jgi:hypothetical protein